MIDILYYVTYNIYDGYSSLEAEFFFYYWWHVTYLLQSRENMMILQVFNSNITVESEYFV